MADTGDKFTRLVGYAQVLAGVSFIIRGVVNVKTSGAPAGSVAGAPSRSRFRRLGEAPQLGKGPAGQVIKSSRILRVGDIADRVKYIRELINKGSLHPEVREKAIAILTKKCGDRWCVREKDYMGEISALFWAIRDPRSKDAVRYMMDHVRVDQFTAADKSLKLHAEDCDGGTIVLGSLLMASGYPVKMRVIASKGAGTWTHIYLLVGIPPRAPTRWVPLDWSVTTASPGWEVEGARDSALSGRPAGLVDAVRDFDV